MATPAVENPARERRAPRTKHVEPPTHARPVDYARRRGISSTTLWRLRHLPGFPSLDVLGRVPIAAADAYIATLDRDALRVARRVENAKYATRRAKGAAEAPSAGTRSKASADGAHITGGTPKSATAPRARRTGASTRAR